MQYDRTWHTDAQLYNSIKFTKRLLCFYSTPWLLSLLTHTNTNTLDLTTDDASLFYKSLSPINVLFIYSDINKYPYWFIHIRCTGTLVSHLERPANQTCRGRNAAKWPANSGQEFRPLARSNPSWSQGRQRGGEGGNVLGKRKMHEWVIGESMVLCYTGECL